MNMKLFKITLLVFVTLLSVACGMQKSECEPIWDNAAIVVYANIGELHSKGNIASLDFSAQIAELDSEDSASAELLTNIIKSPSSSGIAVDKPAYIAINEFNSNYIVSDMLIALEISDAQQLDTTLKCLGEDVDSSDITIKGDKRIIKLDTNLYLGYDSERLVILKQNSKDATTNVAENLIHQLDYAPADMSRFAELDAAVYLDIDRLFAITLESLPMDSEEELYTIEDMKSLYSSYFNPEANATIGLRFDNGAITLTSDCEGISEKITSQLMKVNGNHLNMLDASPIAMLYMGVNGEAIAETLNTAINAMLSEDDAIGAYNEINIYKNIALGIISSIEGDLMLALSNANGELIEDVFGEKKLVFTTANALFTADVKDNYIMDNVKTYGQGLLSNNGNNAYSISAFGNKINIGQNDNIFYVGVNDNAHKKSPSAAEQEWSNKLNDCYAYAMIDFNRLFSSNFGKALLSTIYDNTNSSEERDAVKLYTENLDGLYILSNGNDQIIHNECRISLKNQTTNALEQIVNIAYKEIK